MEDTPSRTDGAEAEAASHRRARSQEAVSKDRCASPSPRRGTRRAHPTCAPLLANFRSVSGDSELLGLGVWPSTTLGDVQRQLCNAFGQSFPKMSATIYTEETIYDDFASMPFTSITEEVSFTVAFELTTDMKFFDESRRQQGKVTCVLPSGERISCKTQALDTYESLLVKLAPHYEPRRLLLTRPDGTLPAAHECIEPGELLQISFTESD